MNDAYGEPLGNQGTVTSVRASAGKNQQENFRLKKKIIRKGFISLKIRFGACTKVHKILTQNDRKISTRACFLT